MKATGSPIRTPRGGDRSGKPKGPVMNAIKEKSEASSSCTHSLTGESSSSCTSVHSHSQDDSNDETTSLHGESQGGFHDTTRSFDSSR